MSSDLEIKHDLLSVESIIINFVKKHNDIFISFGSFYYTLRLSKDNENGIEIDIEQKDDKIELRFFITDNGFCNLQFKEDVYLESLDKRLEEIYKKIMNKWDEEELENESKIIAYMERLKINKNE